MRTLNRMLFLVGAVSAAGAISLPSLVSAFNPLNPPVSLGLSTAGNGYQRDFRSLNNTNQASANSSQTPDPNRPGVLGVGLTMWRAADQWGSQTAQAARNFNFEWQGMSTSNPASGNVMGFDPTAVNCNGGVLAYTLPGNNGWQMYSCDNVAYFGGPGNPSGGQFDLQGVTAHELGHSLGLDHSTTTCGSNCNTHTVMCAFICGSGVGARTIKVDDQAGLTSIYGTIPANKPVITAISGGTHLPLSLLTITGTNFAATVNVKFTAGTSQNTGTIPGVVFNASTTGGTSVTVPIPNEANTGVVTIWEPSLNLLSNPFPITLADCPPPTHYCSAAPNSVNPGGATMGFSGSTSVSANDGVLMAFGLPPNVTNLFFMGQNQTFVPFGNGFRCIAGPFYRLDPVQASIFGDTMFNLDLTNLPQGIQVLAGQSWNFENWYRDPAAGGANYNGSDVLNINYCP